MLYDVQYVTKQQFILQFLVLIFFSFSVFDWAGSLEFRMIELFEVHDFLLILPVLFILFWFLNFQS